MKYYKGPQVTLDEIRTLISSLYPKADDPIQVTRHYILFTMYKLNMIS